MVRKLILSGLAALVLAGAGCSNPRPNDMFIPMPKDAFVDYVPPATQKIRDPDDYKKVFGNISNSWKEEEFSKYDERNKTFSKDSLRCVNVRLRECKSEEDATGYLESLTQKKGEKDHLKTKRYENRLEITRSVGEHFISNDVLAGPSTFYTLATRKGGRVIEVQYEKYKKNGRITSQEKQELRELLYSLVK